MKKTREINQGNSPVEDHFKHFAGALRSSNLRKYGKVPESQLLSLQQGQVERLVSLETEFREAVCSNPFGEGVYDAFVRFICEERGNILDARPYFRERQDAFVERISPALKNRDAQALTEFHGNWLFVSFCLGVMDWEQCGPALLLAADIVKTRWEIVEMNLPLAISRARIFLNRTPRSHLEHMDLVQIAAEGLLSGVDKFCLPFSRRFRAVCIGRMVGNLIEEYSRTMVHFYPGDKRVLYRANKLVGKSVEKWSDLDFDELAERVNGMQSEGGAPVTTTPAELAQLMAAARVARSDDPMQDRHSSSRGSSGKERSKASRYAAPESCRPDAMLEGAELADALERVVLELPIIHRKVLAMKGVEAAQRWAAGG